jgi:hypothetical protein
MKTCKHCNGSGRIAAPPEHRPKSTEDTFVDCPKCGGTGEGSYMIFWAYDQFPYVLGAPGTMEDDGMATVPSYQSKVRPIKVLAMTEGREMLARITELNKEHIAAMRAIHCGFVARLKEVAPWAVKNKC